MLRLFFKSNNWYEIKGDIRKCSPSLVEIIVDQSDFPSLGLLTTALSSQSIQAILIDCNSHIFYHYLAAVTGRNSSLPCKVYLNTKEREINIRDERDSYQEYIKELNMQSNLIEL